MPYTARFQTMTIRPVTYRPEVHHDLRCPDCDAPMHYRHATRAPVRAAHFAHNPRPPDAPERDCALASMTPEHINAIETLLKTGARLLGRPSGVAEYRFCEGKRRADVFFAAHGDTYPVAFEAQYSPIPWYGRLQAITERTADYHAAGVHVVWCFPRSRATLIAIAARVYGVYGILADDGTSVDIIGFETLTVTQHPAAWMADRQAKLDRQAAEQAQQEQLREAARQRAIARQQALEQARREAFLQQFAQEHAQTALERARIAEAQRCYAQQAHIAHVWRDMRHAIISLGVPAPRHDSAQEMRNPIERAAIHAWTTGGSIGLGLWLARHTRSVEHRAYTVIDYGRWVRMVREQSEYRPRITCACCGRFAVSHAQRLRVCQQCGDDLPTARGFVVDLVLRVERTLEERQERAYAAIDRLDSTRRAWWGTFIDAQTSNPERAARAIAKAELGDPDPFFDTIREWLLYQAIADVYAARQQWAQDMEIVLGQQPPDHGAHVPMSTAEELAV